METCSSSYTMHLYIFQIYSYTFMTIVRLNCSYCYRYLYVLSQNTLTLSLFFWWEDSQLKVLLVWWLFNCVYNVCNLYTGCKLNHYGVFIKLWRHHCMQLTVDKVYRKQINIGPHAVAINNFIQYHWLTKLSFVELGVLFYVQESYVLDSHKWVHDTSKQSSSWSLTSPQIALTHWLTIIIGTPWRHSYRRYLHKHLRKYKYTCMSVTTMLYIS